MIKKVVMDKSELEGTYEMDVSIGVTQQPRGGMIITTATGRIIDLLEPKPCDICLEDIAHALSRIWRHDVEIGKYYTIAQHCIAVSYLVPNELGYAALIKDAVTAYTNKYANHNEWKTEEQKLSEVRLRMSIMAAFNLTESLRNTQVIKKAELTALSTEMQHHLPTTRAVEIDIIRGIQPMAEAHQVLTSDEAETLYLRRAWELM